jgi:hypothetical protein
VEIGLKASQEIKIGLPYLAAFPLLNIYLKELKVGSQKVICTALFVVALFTIAKTWIQSKCPLTDK